MLGEDSSTEHPTLSGTLIGDAAWASLSMCLREGALDTPPHTHREGEALGTPHPPRQGERGTSEQSCQVRQDCCQEWEQEAVLVSSLKV